MMAKDFLRAAMVALLVSVAMAGTAVAGPFEDGQDFTNYMRALRSDAERGDANDQLALGIEYADGLRVPQDYAEAVLWYRRAADQGYLPAQVLLGDTYATGRGVKQDYVQAHMWYNLAAAQGDRLAVQVRDDLAKRMTPDQIAEAQKLAREWKPTRN